MFLQQSVSAVITQPSVISLPGTDHRKPAFREFAERLWFPTADGRQQGRFTPSLKGEIQLKLLLHCQIFSSFYFVCLPINLSEFKAPFTSNTAFERDPGQTGSSKSKDYLSRDRRWHLIYSAKGNNLSDPLPTDRFYGVFMRTNVLSVSRERQFSLSFDFMFTPVYQSPSGRAILR